jgi:hypothetical protein
MRNLFCFMIVLLFMTMSPWAQAVRVSSIYKGKIPVASQSAPDRTRALQDGLLQVLVKVTGNMHVLENDPELKTRLSHADALVQEFSYAPAPAGSSLPYILTVRFDPEAINRLLRDEGLPLWGKNRPLILTWLSIATPNHPAEIVDSSGSDSVTLLKQNAERRGLALILPMMDVSDLSQVSVTDILKKNVTALEAATKRYASDAMLIGQITGTGKNHTSFTSQWQLMLGTDQWTWEIAGENLQEIFSTVMNNIGDTLAARYASVTSNAVQSQLVLQIADVKQQTDLLELMKYLQHLTPVAEVQLASVVGNDVTLNVSLRGSKQSFMRAVSLAKNLQVMTNTVLPPQEDTLYYRWAH